MNTRSSLRRASQTIVCLALFAPTFAQEDTTTTERGHSLELGISAKDGAFAKVNAKDGAERAEPDTFTFTTRRRIYTILTEWRKLGSTEDSLAKRMKRLRVERRNQFTHWAGIEIGLNNWITPEGATDLPAEEAFLQASIPGSRFFAINFMEQKLEFGSHHAGLFTGLGLEFLNYRLENDQLVRYDADSVFAIPTPLIDLRKNKIRQIGLRVPLMFEFNTQKAPMPDREDLVGKKLSDPFSDNKNFHFAFGLVGSWYFDTMYKVKYEENGQRQKDRQHGSLNMDPLRVAGRVQLGYASFNLFAEYGLTQVFKTGKGPELVPVNIGITLIGFN